MYKKLIGFGSMIAASLVLVSCSTVTGHDVAPDRKDIYQIDCSGAAIPMSYCYEKAAKMCPTGYRVVSNSAPMAKTYGQGGILSDLLAAQMAKSIPGIKKGITVKCK